MKGSEIFALIVSILLMVAGIIIFILFTTKFGGYRTSQTKSQVGEYWGFLATGLVLFIIGIFLFIHELNKNHSPMFGIGIVTTLVGVGGLIYTILELKNAKKGVHIGLIVTFSILIVVGIILFIMGAMADRNKVAI